MKKWLLRFLILLLILVFIVPFLIPMPTIGADPATFADPDGRFITVNGLETYVRESGSSAGVPVLLLHGWGASTFSWRDTIPALAEAGYRVIAFDRPPYGLSTKTGDNLPLLVTDQAEFTVALMDELGIEQAVLIGHSMGGGVIANLAVQHPERVLGLGFVAAAVQIQGEEVEGGGFPPIVRAALDFAPIARWARIGVRTFVRPDAFGDLQRDAYYDPTSVTPEMLAGYATPLKVEDWDAALLRILAGPGLGGKALTAAEISGISVPVAILWGENDTWVPIAGGERLRELLPEAAWYTYSETGHLPMEEHPADFNRDLLSFVAQEVSQNES